MKRIYIYLIIAVTLFNLTAAGTLIYQRRVHPEQGASVSMPETRFEEIKRELALSPLQISRFEDIRREFHSHIDSLNLLLEAENRKLLREIWQRQPDTTRLDTLLNRIGRYQTESQHLVIGHFFQFKEVLTPEQWQQFYSIVAERFPARMNNPGPRRQPQTEKDTP